MRTLVGANGSIIIGFDSESIIGSPIGGRIRFFLSTITSKLLDSSFSTTCSELTANQRRIGVNNAGDKLYLRNLISGSDNTKVSMFIEKKTKNSDVLAKYIILDLDVKKPNQSPLIFTIKVPTYPYVIDWSTFGKNFRFDKNNNANMVSFNRRGYLFHTQMRTS